MLSNGVTFNGADGFGTAHLTVGAARPNHTDAGYRPYDGLLDEVAIYDHALSAGEVSTIYTNGIPEPSSLLLLGLAALPALRWRRR